MQGAKQKIASLVINATVFADTRVHSHLLPTYPLRMGELSHCCLSTTCSCCSLALGTVTMNHLVKHMLHKLTLGRRCSDFPMLVCSTHALWAAVTAGTRLGLLQVRGHKCSPACTSLPSGNAYLCQASAKAQMLHVCRLRCMTCCVGPDVAGMCCCNKRNSVCQRHK